MLIDIHILMSLPRVIIVNWMASVARCFCPQIVVRSGSRGGGGVHQMCLTLCGRCRIKARYPGRDSQETVKYYKTKTFSGVHRVNVSLKVAFYDYCFTSFSVCVPFREVLREICPARSRKGGGGYYFFVGSTTAGIAAFNNYGCSQSCIIITHKFDCRTRDGCFLFWNLWVTNWRAIKTLTALLCNLVNKNKSYCSELKWRFCTSIFLYSMLNFGWFVVFWNVLSKKGFSFGTLDFNQIWFHWFYVIFFFSVY